MSEPASDRTEFGSGWRVLLAATVGVGAGVSALPFYSAGFFLEPLRHAFGWTRTEISGGSLALAAGIAIGAPLAGRLVDRFGPRRVAIPALLLEAAMFVALSRLDGASLAYVAVLFVMGLLGAGSTPAVFTGPVTHHFRHRRGVALGICLMGAGLTAILAPPLVGQLVADAGWRDGYLALALVPLLAIPTSLLLGMPAAQSAPALAQQARSVYRTILASDRFWILLAASVLAASGVAGMVLHLVPILSERGVTAPVAARTAGMIGVAVIVSRLVIGAALDRIAARFVGAVIMLMAAAAALILAVGAVDDAWIAALLLGAGLGAEIDLIAFISAREFGLEAYGRAYGLIYGVTVLAAGAGPLIFGLFADHGGYRAALASSAVALSVSALLFGLMQRRPETRSAQTT